MEKTKDTQGLAKISVDVKDQVMKKIKAGQVRMKSSTAFFLEKLGLESALVFFIFLAAFLVSATLYVLKKMEIVHFLSFGQEGMRIFLSVLPYDYILLVVVSIFLSVYFVKRLDLPCRKNINCSYFALFSLGVSVILGLFFLVLGISYYFYLLIYISKR